MAHQFALHGVWLALYNTWTSFSIAPMGYVFEGFKPWKGAQRLPVDVTSPAGLAYDRELPFINAAAALSASSDTLLVAISNSAENDAILCRIDLRGFEYTGGRIRRLAGPSITAHNESNPYNVVLRDQAVAAGSADSLWLQPHSVLFLELSGAVTTGVADPPAIPGVFALEQNYPNPFTPLNGLGRASSATLSGGGAPSTVIRYQLPVAGEIELAIYDLTGRRVRTLVRARQSAGRHTITWDGRDTHGQVVASGIYLYRLVTDRQVQVRRLVVVR